ncbi:hypothetical protein L1887_20156 [Cichorium endivia]|nr:hypothetical protein L1887_20156 [Cichorium endivia]
MKVQRLPRHGFSNAHFELYTAYVLELCSPYVFDIVGSSPNLLVIDMLMPDGMVFFIDYVDIDKFTAHELDAIFIDWVSELLVVDDRGVSYVDVGGETDDSLVDENQSEEEDAME